MVALFILDFKLDLYKLFWFRDIKFIIYFNQYLRNKLKILKLRCLFKEKMKIETLHKTNLVKLIT